MKKLFLLLIILLLPASALAEIVGYAGDDLCIRKYIAENGDELYYTSWAEADFVKYEDVNFDGIDDIVALTRMGAQNSGYVFFVKTDSGYLPATEIIWNYVLDSERGLVLSHAVNGYAGALNDMELYRWDGGELKLIRTASSYERAETVFEDGKYTVSTYLDEVRIIVTDAQHPPEEPEDGEYANILMDETVRVSDDDAILAALNRERQILLEGANVQ